MAPILQAGRRGRSRQPVAQEVDLAQPLEAEPGEDRGGHRPGGDEQAGDAAVGRVVPAGADERRVGAAPPRVRQHRPAQQERRRRREDRAGEADRLAGEEREVVARAAAAGKRRPHLAEVRLLLPRLGPHRLLDRPRAQVVLDGLDRADRDARAAPGRRGEHERGHPLGVAGLEPEPAEPPRQVGRGRALAHPPGDLLEPALPGEGAHLRHRLLDVAEPDPLDRGPAPPERDQVPRAPAELEPRLGRERAARLLGELDQVARRARLHPVTDLIEAPPAVRPIHHWVGGRPLAGASGRSGAVYDPATGRQTGAVGFASAEEVDAAVQAAKAAFPAWRALSLAKRAELFFAIRELFDAHREDLARLLTAEHGKVLSDALGEVARGLEVIEYCCGIPTLLKGGYSEQASTGIDVYAIRQPLGVVAGITPFNFPAMVPMWMWAPALACGNTFVLKPSEKDPSASVRTAELLQEAGVPDGVFNVVHGDNVAAVSFVGSTPTARYVYEKATAAGKRCQALGGAKNHMVVLPDADLDMAADAAVSAAYGSAGERCMAVSVVVAVGGVADELVAKISERIPKVKVAAGTEPGAEMGPLVTREHRDRVASYVENAPAEGATVVVDGREAVPEGEGFFLGPTLIDHVRPEMASYRDEIFGPVLGVTRVDTYDEA